MERAVLATPRASAARRLAVYADGYRLRLVEALGNDFPALQALLGQPGFGRMAREFIAAHPSRHPNLRWYGGKLPDFLARAPGWRRRRLLTELARFEWALGLAFDAADASPAKPQELAGMPAADWPGMRLRLDPSVRLLGLRSNAPDLWRASAAKRKPPAARLRTRPSIWLIWRKGHEPFYRALPPAEAWALGAVARGRDFAFLSSGLRRFAGAGGAAQAGAQLLRNWLAEGLIRSVNPARRSR